MFQTKQNNRIKLVFIISSTLLLFVLIKVFYIEVIEYSKLYDLANELWSRDLTVQADRGKILDRNGNILAGKQTASQVGFVPGKINSETKQQDIEKVANLLDISQDTINNSLKASYVTDNTFVPLRTIRKSEQALKNQLLEISAIFVSEGEKK